MKWNRDSQGLHAEGADNDGEVLRYYVRRAQGGWRVGYADTVVIGETRFASAANITWVTTTALQREAKAVAVAFDAEPWSDGGPQSRATRATLRGYEATETVA